MGQTWGVPNRDSERELAACKELRNLNDPEYFLIASRLRWGDGSSSGWHACRVASNLVSNAPLEHLWLLNPEIKQEVFWMEKDALSRFPSYHRETLEHNGKQWVLRNKKMNTTRLEAERDELLMPGSVYSEVA